MFQVICQKFFRLRVYKFEGVSEEMLLPGGRTAVVSLEWHHAPCTSPALGVAARMLCAGSTRPLWLGAPSRGWTREKGKRVWWDKGQHERTVPSTSLTCCVSAPAVSGVSSLSFCPSARLTGYIFSLNTKLHKTTSVRCLYQNFFVEFAERAQSAVSAWLTVLPNSPFLLEWDTATATWKESNIN